MSEKDRTRGARTRASITDPGDERLLTTDRVQSQSDGIVYLKPERLASSAWIEHLPFAFWIIAALGPRSFVELGVHNGVSYCAFCQAVSAASLETKCYAVDSWQGDEHAGHYGSEVFDDLSKHHDTRYTKFSRLIRAKFDDALESFEDGSIDLLHIDGYHTYESVKHDFETWRPKLSHRSVALFHDTRVKEKGFGVFKLWDEISKDYPSFEFHHGHGLGVLGVGQDLPEVLWELFRTAGSQAASGRLRAFFAHEGQNIGNAYLSAVLNRRVRRLRRANADLKDRAAAAEKEFSNLRLELEASQRALADRRQYRVGPIELKVSDAADALETDSLERMIQSWRVYRGSDR